MEKKPIIWAVILLVFLATAGFLVSSQIKNSSENIPYTHSYTKAFCNSTNVCQDFEITCKDKKIMGIRYTGAMVNFQENWQDIRSEETKSKSC